MVRTEAAPEGAAIALERDVEVAVVEERRACLVHEPLGALEGPAAADAEERVGGERGIADEREPRAGCGAHLVRHLELADQLRHPLGTGELGTVGELADHSAVGGLGIGAKLGQPRVVGNDRDHGDVVLVRKDGGAVRIEHPDPGLALRRAYAAPVGEVDEAVVWAHPGGNPGQSSDRRVAPVGGHGERRGERAALMVRALHLDAGDPVPVAEHANHRLAGEVLDARRLDRELAHDRIEASDE